MGVPCETSTPKTSVPVSVWVSKWTRPTAPWRLRAGADVGLGDRVVAAEHDRHGAGGDDLADGSLDRRVRAGRVGRASPGASPKSTTRSSARPSTPGLEVRPGRAARGADRSRPEAGPGPVGDEVVGRRADDRDVDALELGRVLRVRHAAEGEQPREVGLLPRRCQRSSGSIKAPGSCHPTRTRGSRGGSGGGAGGGPSSSGGVAGLGRAAHEQPGEHGADDEDRRPPGIERAGDGVGVAGLPTCPCDGSGSAGLEDGAARSRAAPPRRAPGSSPAPRTRCRLFDRGIAAIAAVDIGA